MAHVTCSCSNTHPPNIIYVPTEEEIKWHTTDAAAAAAAAAATAAAAAHTAAAAAHTAAAAYTTSRRTFLLVVPYQTLYKSSFVL